VDTGGSGDNINGSTASSYINAITGSYEFYYQTNFNFQAAANITASPFATSLLAVFESPSLAGVNFGQPFPPPTQAVGTIVAGSDPL